MTIKRYNDAFVPSHISRHLKSYYLLPSAAKPFFPAALIFSRVIRLSLKTPAVALKVPEIETPSITQFLTNALIWGFHAFNFDLKTNRCK